MIQKTIGARLRALRKRSGLSSTKLGAALGVSHTAVLDWERGRTPIRVDQLQAFAEAVGADLLLDVVVPTSTAAEPLVLLSAIYRTSRQTTQRR